MVVVVDTNIVFSAILTPNGKISKLLLNGTFDITFISPITLLSELENHHAKILKLTRYSLTDYEIVRSFVTQRIQFIPLNDISLTNRNKAFNELLDIDKMDTPFLALAYDNDAFLWTGDKKLISGLANNPITKLITTDILYAKYF